MTLRSQPSWLDIKGIKSLRALRGGLGKRNRLLVDDAFEAHVTERV